MAYAEAYDPEEGIAIVGMAGRFPGARSVEELWRVLLEGRETISHFRHDELEDAIGDAAARKRPAYVRARGILGDIEMFDGGFFGINPREADVLDPQQRVFLETAWEALEDGGYDPQSFGGAIGIFAGANDSTYYTQNLHHRPDVTESVGPLTMMTSNEKDYLATRVAYELDLKGPALTIQTACSTSLVAVCSAVQSLLTWQCDMALAGGVSIRVPQRRGYLWQDGGITSRDGHCRAFDRDATGTVFSSGIGIVLLRRLRDALADGDTIYAVIKGAAVNNDGSSKVSFTAPSVDGQRQVISMAQALGGISPETISYIEAHGTGTALGDPIEIAGLTQAFRAGGAQGTAFCAIGSLKSNIGHLDTAAGVSGLIKATLALHHRMLPASLHFTSPNPDLRLDESPFYVNAQLRSWEPGPTRRRAGVSSFGVGGTNSHVVLEEAPAGQSGPSPRGRQLIVLSARSAAALDRAAERLRAHVANDRGLDLADAAYTLQVGRRAFSHRRAFVARDRQELLHLWTQPDPRRVISNATARERAGVSFMFPGQGAQRVNMARTLYDGEAFFRKEIDECAELLSPHLGRDLRTILYPSDADLVWAQEQLTQTLIAQPALFVIEYALARLLISWGVEPVAMIGHSVGEYVAACLAGVFTRGDALELITRRARMMQDLPSGAMLAVPLPAEEIARELGPETTVAALNAPHLTVISGPKGAVATVEARLGARGLTSSRLQTSHAFHSPMMDPIVAGFTEVVRTTPRAAPVRPWVSSLTGKLITDAEATDPGYWAQQMRQPVRFIDGVGQLMDPNLVLLEVGPGRALTGFARQHSERRPEQCLVAALPGGREVDDHESLLTAIGGLWTAGVRIDWTSFNAGSKRRRISLPTYPFERQRHWVTPLVAPVDVSLPAVPAPAVPVPAEGSATGSAVPGPVANRRSQVVTRLQTLFAELSGMSGAALDPVVGFPDLGLDSLFLIQAVGAIAHEFGGSVTFRDLLEDCSTLTALADRLLLSMPTARVAIGPPRSVAGPIARDFPTASAPLPPQTSAESAQPAPTSFFFGPGDAPIFASYQPPVRGGGDVLTVVCPPLFLEHTRTQYLLRRLSLELAEKGQHVLRFDYRGTGDSFGDLDEVTVSDWVNDVALAVHEGLKLSGGRQVQILGVRAGALLAARFVGTAVDVQKLVLWDPVESGAIYLEELRRVQTTMLERHSRLSRHDRLEALQEYAGHSVSNQMLTGLRSLDGSVYSGVPAEKIHIVRSVRGLRFPVQAVSQDVVPLTCNWEVDSEDLIMPQPALMERLITCLTML